MTISKLGSSKVRLVIMLVIGGLGGVFGAALLALPLKWSLAAFGALLIYLGGRLTKNRHHYLLGLLALSLPMALFNMTLFARRTYFGVPGLSIGIIEIMIAALYIEWISEGRFVADLRQWIKTWPFILVATYGAVICISIYFADDRALSFFGLFAFVKAILLFTYIANNIKSKKQVDTIIYFLLLGTIFQAVLGAAQFVTRTPIGLTAFGENPEVMTMTFGGRAFPRIAGTLVHPNQLSNFLGLQIPLALSFLLIGKSTKNRNYFYGLVFVLGAMTFLLTFSRTGWFHLITSTMVIFLLALFARRITRQTWVFVVILGLLLATILLVFSGNIYLRLTQSNPELVTSRFDMLRVAWRIFMSSPWFGVGINNYVNVMPRFNFLHTLVAPVHNVYFLLLAETGVIGVVAWLTILGTQALKAWKLRLSTDPYIAAIGTGLVGALLGFVVDGVSDFSYALPSTFYLFWLLMGLIIGLVNIEKRQEGS